MRYVSRMYAFDLDDTGQPCAFGRGNEPSLLFVTPV